MKHIPVLSILKYPDLRLLQRAEDVLNEDFAEAVALADSMIEVMHSLRAWGLAAPQVAVPWRLFVMFGPGMYAPLACINPRIVRTNEISILLSEGCLSFPGENNAIERPAQIVAEYTNRAGQLVNVPLTSWQARIFQHEFDHLEGKTFIDYWLPPARKKYLKRLGAGNAVQHVQAP